MNRILNIRVRAMFCENIVTCVVVSVLRHGQMELGPVDASYAMAVPATECSGSSSHSIPHPRTRGVENLRTLYYTS